MVADKLSHEQNSHDLVDSAQLPLAHAPLGHMAVQATEMGLGPDEESQVLASELERVRNKLRGFENKLNVDIAEGLDKTFELDGGVPQSFGQWRSEAEAQRGEHMTWTKWAADAATNDQLVDFLRWNSDYLRNINGDPRVRARIEERRETYVADIYKLYDMGVLHPDSIYDSAESVYGALIYVGDRFELAMHDAHGRTYGYEGGDSVVLMGRGHIMSYISPTFEHELSHLVGDDEEHWVRETGADFVAGAIRTESLDPGQIFAEMRSSGPNPRAYGPADKRLAEVLANPNNVKLFLRYYSAPIESKDACRAELSTALHETTGHDDILARLDKEITGLMPQRI